MTDQLFLSFPSHPLGLCLVTAGRGASIPLKDVFDQPETMWMQFRRRLDALRPYCRVASHTEGEVRDILLSLEHIYRPSFPALNLQQLFLALSKSSPLLFLAANNPAWHFENGPFWHCQKGPYEETVMQHGIFFG